VPPLMSAALVSLLVVGAGWSKLLHSGSEAATVPAEGGCSIISGGGSATRMAVPGAGTGIPGAEAPTNPFNLFTLTRIFPRNICLHLPPHSEYTCSSHLIHLDLVPLIILLG
jgi:hypothetical protein